MHELISCEFITSILLCRFVSQSSRHSHWHVNIVCYSYECRNVHTVSAHCDAFPFAFTQMPHKGSTHTHALYLRLKYACPAIEKECQRGDQKEQGVPSAESAHANNQSMRWPAVESIRIYLQPTYLWPKVAQTNMRHALRLPFASCRFWRFARYLQSIGSTSSQLMDQPHAQES